MLVLLTTTTFVAAALPNVTVAPEAKFVPVIVTEVPPAATPLFGDTLVTVGLTTWLICPIGQTPALASNITRSSSPHQRCFAVVVSDRGAVHYHHAGRCGVPDVTVAPRHKVRWAGCRWLLLALASRRPAGTLFP